MPEVKNCGTCMHAGDYGLCGENTEPVCFFTASLENIPEWVDEIVRPLKYISQIKSCPAWQGDMDLAMALVNFCNCCGIVVLNDDGLIVDEHLYCSQECADQMIEENEECDE